MSDNFYTLDPVDQTVALAYAQTLFAQWLAKNPSQAPSGKPRHLVFAQFLEEGASAALDIRYQCTGSL